MWKIKCKKCDSHENVQTTMSSDEGYSNYTVLDCGCIEFKCGKCGTFGSTDKYKENNELDNFEVICPNCSRIKWDYNIQDVDQENPETHIYCKNCKSVWTKS